MEKTRSVHCISIVIVFFHRFFFLGGGIFFYLGQDEFFFEITLKNTFGPLFSCEEYGTSTVFIGQKCWAGEEGEGKKHIPSSHDLFLVLAKTGSSNTSKLRKSKNNFITISWNFYPSPGEEENKLKKNFGAWYSALLLNCK